MEFGSYRSVGISPSYSGVSGSVHSIDRTNMGVTAGRKSKDTVENRTTRVNCLRPGRAITVAGGGGALALGYRIVHRARGTRPFISGMPEMKGHVPRAFKDSISGMPELKGHVSPAPHPETKPPHSGIRHTVI